MVKEGAGKLQSDKRVARDAMGHYSVTMASVK